MKWELCFFRWAVLLICDFGLLRPAVCSVWTIPDRSYTECPSSATFAAKSAYQQNLNELLLHLTEYGPRTGFSTATKGTSTDQVYGLVLCRGDISSADCKNCLGFAAGASATGCPLGKSAVVYMEKCFLRYDDTDFFRRISITLYSSCSVETASDPNLFYRQLSALMQNLTDVAIARPLRMFAVGEIGYNSSQTIYGLVQCKRDLTAIDCRSCLGSTVADIPNKCAGKQAGRFFGYSCDIRYEAYPFALGFPAASPPATAGASPRLVHPPPNSPGSLAWILPISIFMVSLLFIGFACLLWKGLKRRWETKCHKGDDGFAGASLKFGLDIIKAATNNFSELNKIGGGGFGAVYRGELPNGQDIAVKRLSSESHQGIPEFENEVKLIAKLQHRNLVRLLGCCTEEGEKILVYEYATNGSLDKFIFDPRKREQLRWETRFSIIKGIARGLLYLHEDSRLRIVHRDLKAENILLDEEMRPKVSDFGLARLFRQEETHVSTRKVAGTWGYMAPEYAFDGRVSTKADVYSFGVLLLEIVSGQKITAFRQTELASNFLGYAWRLWREGKALDLIDETISATCQNHEALRCIQIGLLCIQNDVKDRPTMAMVALMFGNPCMTIPPPPAPPLFFQANRKESDVTTEGPRNAENSSSQAEHRVDLSINDMTISVLEAR